MKLSICTLILFSIYIFSSCSRTSKEITKPEKSSEKELVINTPVKPKAPTNEKFEPFYQKFHSDSIFQISRIKFPLQGQYIDTSEIRSDWKKKNWVMHKSIVNQIDTTVYKVEKELTPTQYHEKIYIEGSGFSTERIFKLINGRWYLILFYDENF